MIKPLCFPFNNTAAKLNEDWLKVTLVKNFATSKLPDLSKHEKIPQKPVHDDDFSNTYLLLSAALTMEVSTATCEANFSTVVKIPTAYRRFMEHKRKCQVVLLASEKTETSSLFHEDIISEFPPKHFRLLHVSTVASTKFFFGAKCLILGEKRYRRMPCFLTMLTCKPFSWIICEFAILD